MKLQRRRLYAAFGLPVSITGFPTAPITVQRPPDANAIGGNPCVAIGAEALNDPFLCWTEGPFGLTNASGSITSGAPVNDGACEQWCSAAPISTTWSRRPR